MASIWRSSFDQTIELVRVRSNDEGQDAAVSGVLNVETYWQRIALVAAIPLFIAVVYFVLLAANRFESEAAFVVRSPSGGAVSQVASLVQGSGIISSSEDAYIVHEFLLSRDAMRALIDQYDLLDVFHKSGWDPLWSTPGFFGKPSDERLFKHYKKFVSVDFDKTTGISTLKVEAFTSTDAQRILSALLNLSELMLNKLNARSLKDAVSTAEKQVESSKQRSYQARDVITAFRNREKVIDPTLLSMAVVETVARLSLEMAQLNAQMAEVRSSSPDNPQLTSIRFRLTALESQIANERTQLGGTDASLAPRVAEYDRLTLEREFADQALTSALNTLEVARVDAVRQRTFLEQVSSPSLPDYAKYPYRTVWLLVIAAGSASLFWIAHNMVRDVIAHAES